ncbi:sulfurtransferase TusA family protein [Candidatus Persebacteraceae bacterium Df01]|jgi:tRNA 2-thiouridine synthesizing protein A|uniref:Sulfurtransferase TusA family protein n=1 Tax=Candidatus Doriopsillibacter californiensis TaxID=2970740 RepID=A0ABT7QL96_9GAMM|nr:sulfurtransferase TusA family protein [Candidatus Persebacteraceae bacterium Df01]
MRIEIDLSGLRCPLPVLRVKKALNEIAAGGELRVFASDPEAKNDIPSFLKQAGHTLHDISAADGGHYFLIQKK